MRIEKIIGDHRNQIIKYSIWPIIVSIIITINMIIMVLYMNRLISNNLLLSLMIIIMIISIERWIKDIITESEKVGKVTMNESRGMTIGFILVVISEVCAFLTLFLAYFYNTIILSIELSPITFPIIGIGKVDSMSIPLLNTAILFSSGISGTIGISKIIKKEKKKSIKYTIITIILGIIFIGLQYKEYKDGIFTIRDSVYGSNFYTLTGFHGLHVICGILFIIIALYRLIKNSYNDKSYLNYTYANIYWHFVDYVWIFLFIFLYIWPY